MNNLPSLRDLMPRNCTSQTISYMIADSSVSYPKSQKKK